MATLLEKANQILDEKNTKLLPENLKAGITCLGITGTYEGSSGTVEGIKQFATVEEMQVDATAKEGDLAVVYRSEIQNIKNGDTITSMTFPKTVVFDTAITTSYYGRLRNSSKPRIDLDIQLDASRFMLFDMNNTIREIEYSSTDGITYTRTDSNEDTYEIGETTVKDLDEHICKFIQVGGNIFEGLYEYVSRSDDYFTFGNFTNVSGQSYPNYVAQVAEPREKIMNILTPYLKENGYTLSYLTLVRKSTTEFVAYCSTSSNAPKVLMDSSFIWLNGKTYIASMGYAGESGSYKIDINTETQQCLISPITATNSVTLGGVDKNYFEEITDYTFGMWFHPNRSFTVAYDNGGSWMNTSRPVSDLSVFKYRVAPTQLTATTDYVYEKEFYGKNGVEAGTLTQGVSNSFTDLNAEIYSKIQNAYDNMQPRILTDTDKTIDNNTLFVPAKLDGTPLLDTSNMTNMDNLFAYHQKLIYVSSLDTSKVTSMLAMFKRCSNLTKIPLLDTSNVIYMNSMFHSCTNLTEIPLLDTSKVTSTSSMFQDCTSLTTIPLLNTSSVDNIAGMFYGCTNLTEIPSLDTRSVTNMNIMFQYCSKLTTIPLLNTSKVTGMIDTFKGCTSLSDESLNNVLAMCANATSYTDTKTLKFIGLTSEQATKCTTLSNYSAFTTAGWTTGY